MHNEESYTLFHHKGEFSEGNQCNRDYKMDVAALKIPMPAR